MENSNEDGILMKGRSSQGCIRLGYRLYLSNFRNIFKAAWLPAVVYAIFFSIFTTIGVIQYPRLNISVAVNPDSLFSVIGLYLLIFITFGICLILGGLSEIFFYSTGFGLLSRHKATGNIDRPSRWLAIDLKTSWRVMKGMLFTLLIIIVAIGVFGGIGYALSSIMNHIAGKVVIPPLLFVTPMCLLVIMASLPVVYAMYKYILTPGTNYWLALPAAFTEGLRHWGMLFIAVLVANIVVIGLSAILLLPANILALANFQANLGIVYGDPLGMPDYIVGFTFMIMLVAGFAEAFIRMTIIFIIYYVYGSIETQEEERRKYKARQEEIAEEALKVNARYLARR